MQVSKRTALKIVLVVFGAVCLFFSVHGSGPWSATLTMEKNAQTLVVSRQNEIYYTVTLPETSGAAATYAIRPGHTRVPGWKEMLVDETVLPGPWRLQYGSHEMDIGVNEIRVNRTAHPKGSTVIVK